jgi:hypothetical protein
MLDLRRSRLDCEEDVLLDRNPSLPLQLVSYVGYSSTLKMEMICFSETSASPITTWLYNEQDSTQNTVI